MFKTCIIGSTLPSPRGFEETTLQERADLHMSEFSAHIARMKADRDKKFELEYEVKFFYSLLLCDKTAFV